MANRLSPALIAVSNGVVYRPAAPVIDANPDRVLSVFTIQTPGYSLTLNVYYTFQNSGAGTYTVTSDGTSAYPVKVYEVTSQGWPTKPEESVNQARSFVYVKGEDESVYKVFIDFVQDASGYRGVLAASAVEIERSEREISAFNPDLTDTQKKELVVSLEASGAIVELAGETGTSSPRVMKVRDVDGQPTVVQRSGKQNTTQPLYLYSPSKVLAKISRREAYNRWDEKIEGSFVAQRPTSGRISFTNGEALTAGSYRLVLDSGNIGEVDSAFNGFNVAVSAGPVTVPATLLRNTVKFSTNPTMKFAVVGDLGGNPGNDANNRVQEVADLVHRLKVNDFFPIGDLDYSNAASFALLDANFGAYYHDLMYPYNGTYGAGAADNINRVWPAPGNHDWGNTVPNPNGLQYWHQIFAGVVPEDPLRPGKVKRYYSVLRGDVEFFLLSTDHNEDPVNNPDGVGRTPESEQGSWLRGALKRSAARYKVVLLHHPPYSSEPGKESTTFKWPFKQWGADMIVGGHAHNYERFDYEGIPCVVVGTGGFSIRNMSIDRRSDSYTFTANAATDVFTVGEDAKLATGMAVRLTTTGGLPSGLAAETLYFARLVQVVGSNIEFQLFNNLLDAQRNTNPVLITSAGTGTHTVAVAEPRVESLLGYDHRNGTDPSACGVLTITTTPSRLLCQFINIDNVIRDEFEVNSCRGETVIDFEIPESATVPNPWTLQLEWTNDQDFSDQGFQRNLAIYGYRLEELQSTLFKVSIDANDTTLSPLVEEVSAARHATGTLPSGTWVTRYNSRGQVVDYFNELSIYPRNDNFVSAHPLAELLTGASEFKREDLLLKTVGVVSGSDAYVYKDPVASAPPAVTISYPGGSYKVGDTVAFTATSAIPNLTYIWSFWDGTTYVSPSNPAWSPGTYALGTKKSYQGKDYKVVVASTSNIPTHPDWADITNVAEKKLNRGGSTPLLLSVSVVDDDGNSGYSTSTITVNAPPEIKELSVSANDTTFPYDTTLGVLASDPEGTNVTVKWKRLSDNFETDPQVITPGTTVPVTTARTVAQFEIWRLTATDAAGAATEFDVELRGTSTAAAVVALSASPASQRIGPSQNIIFTGRAIDINSRNGTIDYSFEFTFWDGTTASGTVNSPGSLTSAAKVGDFTYEAIVSKSVASAPPGTKLATLKVTEGSLTSQAEVRVELIPNQRPTITSIVSSAPSGVIAGTSVTFSALASDPDGDPLTYRWNFTSPTVFAVTTPSATVQTSVSRQHAITSSELVFESTLPGVSAHTPIEPGSVEVLFQGGKAVDNGLGAINASGMVASGTIDYLRGVVSLVATAAGSFTVNYTLKHNIRGTLTVADPYGGSHIMAIPPVIVTNGLTITSELSVQAVVLLDFSYQIKASGSGPYDFSTGPLPAGLLLNTETGTIYGQPKEVSTFLVPITVKTKDGSQSDTKSLSISVVSTRSARPPAPTNLQVFNDGVNPTYSSSTLSIPIRWTIARDQFDATAEVPTTLVEIRSPADELKGEISVDAGVDTYELSIDELVGYLGGKTDFVVYAYHMRNNLRSTGYDKLQVLKV